MTTLLGGTASQTTPNFATLILSMLLAMAKNYLTMNLRNGSRIILKPFIN